MREKLPRATLYGLASLGVGWLYLSATILIQQVVPHRCMVSPTMFCGLLYPEILVANSVLYGVLVLSAYLLLKNRQRILTRLSS